MHGGSVSVESAGLGEGSTFTIRLPLHQPTEVAQPVGQKTNSLGGHLKILIVDDNQDTVTSAAMLLRAYGHEVQTAHDGPTALELANAFQPQAILLDIGLPGMNGYEVAQSLRRRGFQNTTIIAVSGYAQAEDRQRSSEAGFDHHFVKPVDYANVLTILNAGN
jgi:CheY-like chemotaxis protein